MAALPELTDLFMAWQGARPWEWSVVDCAMTPADLAVFLGSPDPVPGLRGTYHSEEECRAVVAEHGGLLPLFSRLETVGWKRTQTPAIGSIAVIGSRFVIDRQWGAIRHDGRWQVRMDIGFVPFTARPLAIWSL